MIERDYFFISLRYFFKKNPTQKTVLNWLNSFPAQARHVAGPSVTLGSWNELIQPPKQLPEPTNHTHLTPSFILGSSLHHWHMLISLSGVSFTTKVFILHLTDLEVIFIFNFNFIYLFMYFLLLLGFFFLSALLLPTAKIALFKLFLKVCLDVYVWDWWTASRTALRWIWKGGSDMDSRSRRKLREVWVVHNPCPCHNYVFTFFFHQRERQTDRKRWKNNPLKKSLITSQSPWFHLMSCLFLLGGSVMRKTTLPATVKLDTQPNKIANKIYFFFF